MATVVAFNAHPDDEALFSGGTLARLAAAGNRVVIVVATGLRLDELRESAAILGGYGHRDHIKVHQVGARAAQFAGRIPVLEVTAPRELMTWPHSRYPVRS